MGGYLRKQITDSYKNNNSKRGKRERAGRACNGYVFIIVLWVIVVLSFIAIGSLRSTRVSVNLQKVFEDRVTDLYAAKNACLFAMNRVQVGEAQSGTETVTFIDFDKDEDEDEEAEYEDVLNKPWVPDPEPYRISIDDVDCDVHIEDEGGKINLNSINDDNKDILIEFLLSKELKEEDAEAITDAVIDWKDEDDLHHIKGAETPYYESLPEPYEAKNSQFDSKEELLLVRGITPIIFDKIREEVTVFGGDKINLNFADRDVILSIPGIDEEAVDALMEHINENGSIKNEEELRSIFFSIGVAGAGFEDIRKFITLESKSFVTIRCVCWSSGNADSGNKTHQYRIIADISEGNRKILAVYPD